MIVSLPPLGLMPRRNHAPAGSDGYCMEPGACQAPGLKVDKSGSQCHNRGIFTPEKSLESSPSCQLSTPHTDAG